MALGLGVVAATVTTDARGDLERRGRGGVGRDSRDLRLGQRPTVLRVPRVRPGRNICRGRHSLRLRFRFWLRHGLGLGDGFDHRLFSILAMVFWGGFSMLLIILLIGFALRPDNRSTFNKLAAISAAYIAFPQFWNAVFLLIQVGDPAAFRAGPGLTSPLCYQDMLYFSYNVFTTVDVSDTLPASRLASAAVVIAEILAQLYGVRS